MDSTLAAERTAAPPAPRSLLRVGLLCGTLGFLWFMLCRQLSYEWAANEQYSYGWFVPFFAAFLFWLRLENKKEATPTEAGNGVSSRPSGFLLSTLAFLLFAALLPIRLFEVANPDWRPLSWMHALIVVTLTLLLIDYCGGRRALRHFAFPVCFILVAVPWVTPIEAPVVQGLMKLVAAIATETLTLFGIPAQLEGSLIRVSNGVVGVSEACSGVRSLQTSLMIGLLFGELKRLTTGRRVGLVAAALLIAFVANCGRAFFLVWIAATQNLAAVEHWHDLAGYAIVGAVFLGTVGIASWLAKGRRQKDEGRNKEVGDGRLEVGGRRRVSEFHLPRINFSVSVFSFSAFVWLLLTEAGVSFWYRWHERNLVPTTAWSVHWPEKAPGFHDLPIPENIRSTLRYDRGREAAWRFHPVAAGKSATPSGSCTMFFFRWGAGSASILRARAHRPDICLPNTGWRLTSDEGVRMYRASDELTLPFRHFRFVHDESGNRKIYADAFFCEREDRIPRAVPDRFDATAGDTGNWLRSDRVRVVREGLRNQGQQVLELVMMKPNEQSTSAMEDAFAKMVPELVTDAGEKK